MPSSQVEHLCMTVYFVTLQKHGPIRACPRLSQKSAQKPPTNVALYGYNSMKARKRLATEWFLEEKKKRRMEGQVTHKLLTGEQTVSHELTGTHGARPLSHGYGNARSWYSSGGWRASISRAKERKNERKIERKCYTKRTAEKGPSTAQNPKWQTLILETLKKVTAVDLLYCPPPVLTC